MSYVEVYPLHDVGRLAIQLSIVEVQEGREGALATGTMTGVPLQTGIDPEPRVAIGAVERSGGQEKVATPPSSRPYRTPRLSVSRHEA